MTNHNGHDHQSSTRTMTTQETTRRAPSPKRRRSRGFPWFGAFIFLVLAAGLVGLVLWHKSSAQAELNTRTQQMAEPTVLVVHPQKGDSEVHLTLPGAVSALMESSVYAQVSGYIKAWHADIGAQVKAGDLLAEIETPVTDQQLKQAQESVKQAEANLNLAKVTADRYIALLSSHAVAQQDVDNQNASEKVQEANLSAAQAFENGIEKTEAFKQVRAPYDGVVTARRIDVGDYVSATGQTGTTSSSASGPAQTGTPNQELFRIAQTKTLRIYVDVPENFADEVVPGIKATVNLASAPNTPATGTLVRTADAIDPGSLTLLSEVDVDNPNGKLIPGGYAQVHFDITTTHPPMVIPGNALIFRSQGTQVGVVDMDTRTVHIKDIKIGRDLGTKLEVIDGIEDGDAVILNPSDSLTDGAKVNVKVQPDGNQSQASNSGPPKS